MIKKQVSQMAYRKIFLVSMMFIMSILITNSVVAWELNPFAEVISSEKVVSQDTSPYLIDTFNSKYGTIKLSKTLFWIETDKIAEYSLISNTEQCLINCESIGKAVLYTDGVLFEDTLFKDKFGNNQNLKYQYYLKYTEEYIETTPQYKHTCSGTKKDLLTGKDIDDCKDVLVTTINETKTRDVWKEYKGEELKAGNYEWKLIGTKNPSQVIDFIPIKNNKELSEWAWWNNSWSKCKPVNITGGATALTDFPFYVNVTYDSDMQADFDDVRFVNGSCNVNGNELSHELDYKTNSVGAGFWVKANLSVGQNNFSMYYGNGAATSSSNGKAVWTNGFVAVYHFSECTGSTIADSLGNYNGTIRGTLNWNTTSTTLGCSMQGNGANTNYVTVNHSAALNVDANSTIEAMYRPDAFLAGNYAGMGKAGLSQGGYEAIYSDVNGYGVYTETLAGNGNSRPDIGLWSHEVVVNDGTTIRPYGSYARAGSTGAKSATPVTTVQNLTIGARAPTLAANTGVNGLYDEVRIQNLPRSVEWINRTYLNTQMSYFSFGVEQSGGGSSDTMTVANSHPLNNTNVSTSSVTFGCNATSTGNNNITSVTMAVSGTSVWNQTVSGLNTQGYNASFTNSTLSDGTFTWQCFAYGSTTNATGQLWTLRKDATAPSMAYGTSTETDGATLTRANIVVNITATDTNLNNMSIFLYNSTYNLLNVSSSTTSPLFKNYTGLGNGTYYFNATAQDTFGNNATLSTRTVTINTGTASISVIPSNPVNGFNSSSSNVTFGCNITSTGTNITSVVLNASTWTQTINLGAGVTNYNASFTNSSIPDGNYNWNCLAYGNVANGTGIQRSLLVDTVRPSISFVYPTESGLYNNANWYGQLNYTYVETNPAKCWYFTGTGAYDPAGPFTYITCGQNVTGLTPYQYDLSNYWAVGINDSAGNTRTMVIYFAALTNNPVIINTTVNNSNFTSQAVLTTFANQSGTHQEIGGGLVSQIYNSPAFPINVTYRMNNIVESSTCQEPVSFTGIPIVCDDSNITGRMSNNFTNVTLTRSLPDNTYLWNYTIVDLFGNNVTSQNYVFNVDNTKPQVRVFYPNGLIIDLSPGTNITVNFTATDTNLAYCWINYNGNNLSIPCNNNASIIYALGINNLTVWANDTFGNLNSSFTSWSPGVVLGNASYTGNVYETSTQTFSVNYSLTSILSSLASMTYNGTNYPSTVSCAGNICTATNTFDIPVMIAGNQYSFWWNITAYNGTAVSYQNTSVYTQNISTILLTNCASGNITLNFTAYDEQNRTNLNPYSFDSTIDYYLGSGSTYKQLNVTNVNAATIAICMNPSLSYKVNSITAYSAPNSSVPYVIRNHFFQNHIINATTQFIKLYLLKSSSSTSFVLQVQGSTAQAEPSVLVNAQRCYPGIGINETAFISRTDSSGLTVGNFEAETALYKFFITKNDTTLLSVDQCSKVVPQTSPYTLLFEIGNGYQSPFLDLNNVSDLYSDVVYNATTNTITYTYIDSSNRFRGALLRVTSLNFTGNNEPQMCYADSNFSSGVLTCSLAGNGPYSTNVFVYRNNETFFDQKIVSTNNMSDTLGYYGVFLGWFLILICAFAFKFNEIAGIWLVNAAIFFCNYIGLIAFGNVFVTSTIAIGILITAVLER